MLIERIERAYINQRAHLKNKCNMHQYSSIEHTIIRMIANRNSISILRNHIQQVLINNQSIKKNQIHESNYDSFETTNLKILFVPYLDILKDSFPFQLFNIQRKKKAFQMRNLPRTKPIDCLTVNIQQIMIENHMKTFRYFIMTENQINKIFQH